MGFNGQILDGDTKKLIEKWSNSKLKDISVDSIKDDFVKGNASKLLENQYNINYLTGAPYLTEDSQGSTTTSVIGQLDANAEYRPLSLALVRRTFPDLFANKVVGVQPMSTPVGLAYALRVLYKDMGHEAAWDVVDKFSGFTGSLSGTSGTADAGTGASTTAAEGWNIGTEFPELQIKLDQTSVTAKSRKLAASFSLEAVQDIRALHGVEIEREILRHLQYEILAELDREIVARLKTSAQDTANGGAATIALDLNETATSATGYVDGRWSQEQIASVLSSIVHQANVVASEVRRGSGANFVIASPAIVSLLQAARPRFVGVDPSVNGNSSMAEVGTIDGQITVYRDTYATSDYALVGYKGPGISDAGVIYSPYVMGVVKQATAQEDFSPRIGVMSRYALTDSLLGTGRYYRYITFANVSNVIPGA